MFPLRSIHSFYIFHFFPRFSWNVFIRFYWEISLRSSSSSSLKSKRLLSFRILFGCSFGFSSFRIAQIIPTYFHAKRSSFISFSFFAVQMNYLKLPVFVLAIINHLFYTHVHWFELYVATKILKQNQNRAAREGGWNRWRTHMISYFRRNSLKRVTHGKLHPSCWTSRRILNASNSFDVEEISMPHASFVRTAEQQHRTFDTNMKIKWMSAESTCSVQRMNASE